MENQVGFLDLHGEEGSLCGSGCVEGHLERFSPHWWVKHLVAQTASVPVQPHPDERQVFLKPRRSQRAGCRYTCRNISKMDLSRAVGLAEKRRASRVEGLVGHLQDDEERSQSTNLASVLAEKLHHRLH